MWKSLNFALWFWRECSGFDGAELPPAEKAQISHYNYLFKKTIMHELENKI
jgi:hypothetical protein